MAILMVGHFSCMHIVHMQVFSKVNDVMLHAISSPAVLVLRRSFWGCSVLVRVVYLAGYQFAHNISGTVVLLYS